MKKLILIIAVLYSGINIYAQENDTTKIKLGDTKVIIIEKKKNDTKTKKEKLEKGKEEFENMLRERKNELSKQKELLDENRKMVEEQRELLESQVEELAKQEAEKKIQESELEQKEKEEKIKELEKEIYALERGIEGIDNEIDSDEDFNNDKNDKWSHKKDFDWDFEDEWPSDWDNLSPFGRKKRFRGHWAGFELGLNNFVNKDFQASLNPEDRLFELNPERSWAFSLNFMEFNIPFTRGSGLVTGMGTTWNNYHFRNNVNIVENTDGVMEALLDTEHNYSKNTLNLWYITIPLIFEFQIPVSKSRPGIHVGGGVVGSVKLTSKMKQHYDGFKYKNKSDFQIPALKYGLTFRAGYEFIKLFANYDMTTLFKKDRGPEIYPFSVGLTLISF